MTTVPDALHEFRTDTLQALAESSLAQRNEAAKSGNSEWAALMNAVLCEVVDEQESRRRAEAELFDRLELEPSPIRVIGVDRPGA